MKKIHEKYYILNLAICLFMIGTAAIGQTKSQRPNFIIVVTDDQGYGDAGYSSYSNVITPNLDNLAETGLRLDRYYSAPVCSPTRASILTGRYPTRVGVFSWGHALRPQEQTIANILKDHGYQTGFFGKWHLGSVRPDQPTSPRGHGFETYYAAANFYENDPWMSKDGVPVQLKGESSDVTVELALNYIREAVENDAPFLVFIWLGSPHLPHESLDYLKNLYPDQSENMKNYLGEITGIDLAMGKLRNEVKDMGLAENTLLWFSSDNGGKFPEGNNGNLKDQKGSLYEGGIRIPALIEWPGKIKTTTTNIPAGTVDVFPTLLELAGIDDKRIEHPIDGISLVPLFQGKIKDRSRPLGFWIYPEIKGQGMKSDEIILDYKKVLAGELDVSELNEGLLNTPEQNYPGLNEYPYSGTYAWIDNDWKLYCEGTMCKLYNLYQDPGEKIDLSKEYPERVKSMSKELSEWQQSVIRSVRGFDYK